MELPKVKTDLPMPECKPPKADLSSLRDEFAMRAMQGIISAGTSYDYEGRKPLDVIVEHAYTVADAMLQERAK